MAENGSPRRTPPALVVVAGAALVAVIGLLDHLTGPEVGFSIFYLIPIALVSWTVGGRAGSAVSLAAGGAWLAADLSSSHTYSHPAIPYWNMAIRMGFFLVVAGLLAKLRDVLARESASARLDALTGVRNLRSFLEVLAREAERSRRHGLPLSVVYLDVDNFKTVNDTLGHAEGDGLLRDVGQALGRAVRAEDYVARLGGDEFAVLLVHAGAPDAEAFARRIQALLLDAMRARGWPATFSIGVATFAEPPASAEELIRAADGLMYEAKRSGKNAIRQKAISTASGAGPG